MLAGQRKGGAFRQERVACQLLGSWLLLTRANQPLIGVTLWQHLKAALAILNQQLPLP